MRVMVVGASRNRNKYGFKAVVAYQRQGHEVFPVNPAGGEIAGLRVFTDVASVPGPIDRVSIYLPPETGIDVLDAIARRGDVSEVWFNPGSESPELVEKAKQLGLDPTLACSIVAIGENPGSIH
jgi:hypothetical protein